MPGLVTLGKKIERSSKLGERPLLERIVIEAGCGVCIFRPSVISHRAALIAISFVLPVLLAMVAVPVRYSISYEKDSLVPSVLSRFRDGHIRDVCAPSIPGTSPVPRSMPGACPARCLDEMLPARAVRV